MFGIVQCGRTGDGRAAVPTVGRDRAEGRWAGERYGSLLDVGWAAVAYAMIEGSRLHGSEGAAHG